MDFKSYVLGTMFYRYISENLSNCEREADNESFDCALMSYEDAECAKNAALKKKAFSYCHLNSSAI